MLKQFQKSTNSNRLITLDAVRGLLIVVMALDHANSFIAHGKLQPELWADLFPSYVGHPPITFLTRLVTHLAAPGFFFLMGTGMFLFARSRQRKGWSFRQILVHFLIRGLLLIFLQFTLENMAWSLKEPIGIYFGVLYGLGAVMIVSSLFLYIPSRFLWLVSTLLIVISELLLPQTRTGFIEYPLLIRMWSLPGFSGSFLVLYPIIPWLGVCGFGIVYGRKLAKNTEAIYRKTIWIGLVILLLFIIIRRFDAFGNIRPLNGSDWIAFLNVVKYPPSISFLLLTLGVLFLLLALFSRLPWVLQWSPAVFGRVPLFFYISHLFLYGLMGRWFAPDGIGIPRMFPYWLLGLILLWPLCLLYGRFKQRKDLNSFWRLF